MTIVGALPFTLQNGQIADATQVMADFNTLKSDVNTKAAANGANNDITSLAGLTTPLSVAQGGTGYTDVAHVFMQGYLFGLTMSNTSGGTTAISIAAGACRDSTNAGTLVLSSALTGKVLGTAWSVGNSGGLLDTGAVANTTYHVYLITRLDTGVVDAIASTSASAPTLPANYTLYRRIGSILRESGAIVVFQQYGDLFKRTPVADRSSTAAQASVLLALSIPTGLVLRPVLTSLMQANISSNVSTLLGDAATGSANVLVTQSGIQDYSLAICDSFVSNTSSQIYFAAVVSVGSVQVNVLSTLGWIDTRGRLAP